jgi:hypothetical protein
MGNKAGTQARTEEQKQTRIQSRKNATSNVLSNISQFRNRFNKTQTTTPGANQGGNQTSLVVSGQSLVVSGQSLATTNNDMSNNNCLMILDTLQKQMERGEKPFTKADYIMMILSLKPDLVRPDEILKLQKLTIPDLIVFIRIEICDVAKIVQRLENQSSQQTNNGGGELLPIENNDPFVLTI